MARLARVEVFAPDEIAIVHVMNRTVRRCFLMGTDPLTNKNFDHRKAWLEIELQRQAALFGIDLLCFAILSNHFHLVLRSRPDVVAQWDDRQVARRWLLLCPKRKDADKSAMEPNDVEINSIVNDPVKLASVRLRLSDISWWMRLLSQNIAQRANRDDVEVGKFWQSRYKAVRLLDETAILACAAYVDLNPIRAAMADTIESSDYTSVQRRTQAIKTQIEEQAVAPKAARDRFLAPLEINERTDSIGPCVSKSELRASDKGFLSMPTAAYLDLLDWTARQLRQDKRGATPACCKPIFERLGISGEVWCELVKEFGRLFYAVAGTPHQIDHQRSPSGRQRYKTRMKTRELLAS